jgi:hypothetical protein
LSEGKVGGGWFLPVGLGLVAVDQITKFLVEGKMSEGLEVPILSGLFLLGIVTWTIINLIVIVSCWVYA